MSLISVANAKILFGISATDTNEDASLALLAAYASSAIKAYCKRDIETTTYPNVSTGGTGDSGYYSGNDTPYLPLRQTPVTSVTSVYHDASGRFGQNPDGSFAAATLLTYGTDYVIRWDGSIGASSPVSHSGILEKVSGSWPALARRRIGNITPYFTDATGNIKVAYVAGWATIPKDLEAACMGLVAHMRRTLPFGGGTLASESMGAYSYSLATAALNTLPELGSTRQLLARYRRQVIA